MNAGIEEAYEAYQAHVIEHDCPESEDCSVPQGFYLIGFVDEDGNLATWSGGHQTTPAQVAEAVIGVTDAVIGSDPDLTPLRAFMKSRDIFHTAADQVPPPPDASAAMQDFVHGLGKEDQDD